MAELVKDVYLGDLPENIQSIIMGVHKMIVDVCNSEIKRSLYDDIRDIPWTKEMLNEFLRQPKTGDLCGSARIYRKGKRYRCMIQVTGHPMNNRNTEEEELFHGFIRNSHVALRSKVRRKFDVTLTCESEHGEHFEGFDIWTKSKVAKEIWESISDAKVKPIKREKIYESLEYVYSGIDELPDGLKSSIKSLSECLNTVRPETVTCIIRRDDTTSSGYIELTSINGEITLKDANRINEMVNKELICKTLSIGESYCLNMDPEYADKLASWMNQNDPILSFKDISMIGDDYKMNMSNNIVFEAATEPDEKEYNADLSPAAAKRTLGTITQSIINDKNKNVNQYTADIFSNIISKNLLGAWAKGYRKVSITIDPKLKGAFLEFKVGALTMDFVSRFVEGRESINGFLHRSPDIRIRMSAQAFKTIQSKDDAFNFFRSAIKYYDTGIAKYSERFLDTVMRLPKEMRRLISTSKLSGIITVPMQMLFSFDDIDMSSTTTFNISKDDINEVTSFIKNIYTNYASPEKEKQKIISDLTSIVYHLKESCDLEDNRDTIYTLAEAVSDFYAGKYTAQLQKYRVEFEAENVDIQAMNEADHSVKVLYEKFGVKKLKKIPRDLVAYISIETESIRDANDKMMIASYCLSKLEIVEWYIELLEVGSKKYIVPHSKPYLDSVRTQLLACYDRIMKVKIVNPNSRPLIDIKYPTGYEG